MVKTVKYYCPFSLVSLEGVVKDRDLSILDQVKDTSLNRSFEQDNLLICKCSVWVGHRYSGHPDYVGSRLSVGSLLRNFGFFSLLYT